MADLTSIAQTGHFVAINSSQPRLAEEIYTPVSIAILGPADGNDLVIWLSDTVSKYSNISFFECKPSLLTSPLIKVRMSVSVVPQFTHIGY